jgi:hypothetical protein
MVYCTSAHKVTFCKRLAKSHGEYVWMASGVKYNLEKHEIFVHGMRRKATIAFHHHDMVYHHSTMNSL